MNEAESVTRYIIQVDRPGQELDMSAVHNLLEGTGIELDGSYGPVLINPKLGRYVVRGTATPEARAKAEQIPGIRLFADTRQQPLSR
jgi:hypothetical protein